MPAAGDRYEMPDGSVYALVTPSASTGGEEVEFEFVLPHRCVPPPHVHSQGTETYEVIEGSLEVMIDGEWRSLAAGDSATVPTGALHTFRNRSGATARVRNWHRPAMGFDVFIADMHSTLARAGVTGRRDPRVMPLLSKVFLDHPATLAPGRRRERIGMRALAAVGRRL